MPWRILGAEAIGADAPGVPPRPPSHHDGMTTLTTPQAAAAATKYLDVPSGDDERVVGFGVMGLPFANGHYLAFRDFPATSFSPS
jgi:hypothetical protein